MNIHFTNVLCKTIKWRLFSCFHLFPFNAIVYKTTIFCCRLVWIFVFQNNNCAIKPYDTSSLSSQVLKKTYGSIKSWVWIWWRHFWLTPYLHFNATAKQQFLLAGVDIYLPKWILRSFQNHTIQVVQVHGFLRKRMEISNHEFLLFYICTMHLIRSCDCLTIRFCFSKKFNF